MYPLQTLQKSTYPIQQYFDDHNIPAPIVVGGVGGSGTRLVVQILENMGISMGHHRNISEDAMSFVPVYENHINPFLAGRVNTAQLEDDLFAAIRAHRGDYKNTEQWGWKNPRSIYLLPLLHALFKEMRFIHVVRDGLAMSSSKNQNQLEKHGVYIVPSDIQSSSKAEKSLMLWSIVNNAAADFGAEMKNYYLSIRYEDVCEDVEKSMEKIASFLNIKNVMFGTPEITPSRTRDTRMLINLVGKNLSVASTALNRFGYTC